DGRNQFVQERLLRLEMLATVSLRATKDGAQDVAALLIARYCAVGQRKRQRPDVVGDHAVRRVLVVVELAGVRRRTSQLADRLEQGGKHGVVVVACLAL